MPMGMKPFNAIYGHARSVIRPGISRLIFAGSPAGRFLLLCREHRSQATYIYLLLTESGAQPPTALASLLLLALPLLLTLQNRAAEIDNRKHPNYYYYFPPILFCLSYIFCSSLLLDFLQPLSNLISNSTRSI